MALFESPDLKDGLAICGSLTNSIMSAMNGSNTDDGLQETSQSVDSSPSSRFHRNSHDERNIRAGDGGGTEYNDESNACFKPMEANEVSNQRPGRILHRYTTVGGSPQRITNRCLQQTEVIRLPANVSYNIPFNNPCSISPPHRINHSPRSNTRNVPPHNEITRFSTHREFDRNSSPHYNIESYSPQSDARGSIPYNAGISCSPHTTVRSSTDPCKGARCYSPHSKDRKSSPYQRLGRYSAQGEYRDGSPCDGARNSSSYHRVGSGSPQSKVRMALSCKEVTRYSTHNKFRSFPQNIMRSGSVQSNLTSSPLRNNHEPDSLMINKHVAKHNDEVYSSKQCISTLSLSPRTKIENINSIFSFGEFNSMNALDLAKLNPPCSPNSRLKYTSIQQIHNQNESECFERSHTSRQRHTLDNSYVPLDGINRDNETDVALNSTEQPAEVLEAFAEFENDLVFLSGCPNKISTPKGDKCSRLPDQKQWVIQRRSPCLGLSRNSTLNQVSHDGSSSCTDNSSGNSSSSYCTSSLPSKGSPECIFDSDSSTATSYRSSYRSSSRNSSVDNSSAIESPLFSCPIGIPAKVSKRKSIARMDVSRSQYERNRSPLSANRQRRESHSLSPLSMHYQRRSLSHSPLVPRLLESDRAFLQSSSASKVHSNSITPDFQKRSVRRCLPFGSSDTTQKHSTTTTCRGDFLPKRAVVNEGRPFRRLQQSSDDIFTSVDDLLEVTNLFGDSDTTDDYTARPNGDNRDKGNSNYKTVASTRDSDTISSFNETFSPSNKSYTPKPLFQTEDEEAVYYLITKYLENEDVKW